MFWHLIICLGWGVVLQLACYVGYSVYFFTFVGCSRISPFTLFSSNHILYMGLKQKAWDGSSTATLSTKLELKSCFTFAGKRQSQDFVICSWMNEVFLITVLAGFGLEATAVESLCHGIESGLIHMFISLMFLGFPVEGGLGKGWMMAAWRGSWWESC